MILTFQFNKEEVLNSQINELHDACYSTKQRRQKHQYFYFLSISNLSTEVLENYNIIIRHAFASCSK